VAKICDSDGLAVYGDREFFRINYMPRTRQPHHIYTSAPFKPYLLSLGQLTVSWNGLHETLGLLFSTVMQAEVCNQTLAVWQSINNDRMKRGMLKAAALNDFRGAVPTAYPDDVIWLCAQIDGLEDARNDAVHSPIRGYGESLSNLSVKPATELGNQRAKKLLNKGDVLLDLRKCRDKCVALAKFAHEMDQSLIDYTKPWPARPSGSGAPRNKKRRA
jgi:hypothetical protein